METNVKTKLKQDGIRKKSTHYHGGCKVSRTQVKLSLQTDDVPQSTEPEKADNDIRSNDNRISMTQTTFRYMIALMLIHAAAIFAIYKENQKYNKKQWQQ